MTTARERYEAKTRVVTFRVSQELYEDLEGIRGKAGLSFADLIKLGAGIGREEIQKKLSEVSELQAQLAELRKTIRQEQKTLDAFIDTTKKEQLAKLEQQYQIYTLFDAGFSTDEVRFKMGISKSDVSRHFKEWGELRGEKEKLQAELLKKCLRNYILSLREYIQYRACLRRSRTKIGTQQAYAHRPIEVDRVRKNLTYRRLLVFSLNPVLFRISLAGC